MGAVEGGGPEGGLVRVGVLKARLSVVLLGLRDVAGGWECVTCIRVVALHCCLSAPAADGREDSSFAGVASFQDSPGPWARFMEWLTGTASGS